MCMENNVAYLLHNLIWRLNHKTKQICVIATKKTIERRFEWIRKQRIDAPIHSEKLWQKESILCDLLKRNGKEAGFTCCSNSFCFASNLLLSSKTVALSDLPCSEPSAALMRTVVVHALSSLPFRSCSPRAPSVVMWVLYVGENLCNSKWAEETRLLVGIQHKERSMGSDGDGG